jgi:hypothetical protein
MLDAFKHEYPDFQLKDELAAAAGEGGGLTVPVLEL